MTEQRWASLLVASTALALAAGAGCYCPDAYFTKDQRFEVTVAQTSSTASYNPCAADARPPALAPGDSFVLTGTGDQSFEAGMCDDGMLVPGETPTFATDILTSCDPYTGCVGQTADGCTVRTYVSARRDETMPVGGGEAAGILSMSWNSACDPAFNCEERYDVRFRPVAR